MAEVTACRKKQEKMGNRACPDRLSNLPLSIIHLILARVPIRDAIRTSFLSRQWRYTWTTLPYLLFNSVGLYNEMMEGLGDRMCKFIDNVLLHHKGPIHRFEMSLFFHFNIQRIEEWVVWFSKNNIRELIIGMHWLEGSVENLLKSNLYSCTKLTKLELWNFILDPPPSTFKGFLFLTSLDFVGVTLSPNGLKTLIANCPLLERLKIDDYEHQNSRQISVSAPNLKYLYLLGKYVELSLNAPLLADMYMKLEAGDFTPEGQSLECNYSNLFRSFMNLVNLTGHGYFARYLSIGIQSCRHALVLHHLKVIKLTGVNFGDIKETLVVARLIVGAPNLHELNVTAATANEEEEYAGFPYVSVREYLGCATNFRIMKLRIVSLTYVCRYRSGMQLIKFLLESSPVLETMELDFFYSFRSNKVSSELLGFRRASPSAIIVVPY